jgi:hypothetical protein
MSPLLGAAMVAVSRTADSRRKSTANSMKAYVQVKLTFTWTDHWQDVTVGSLLGLGICKSLYRLLT